MTCKHCGAAAYREAYNPEFPPPKKWLCGTINGMRSPACYESEIEKLREKKAQGLTWEWMEVLSYADGLCGRVILYSCDEFSDLYIVRDQKWKRCKDDDAAKAHAEELHQQAWRELRARWDFKGGGK